MSEGVESNTVVQPRLHHVNLKTTRLQEMIDWYTIVVDGSLKVYGIEKLRIADGSIMPRVTTGNTMAPCVIIGERAADILQTEYQL
jgi:hypothetical protein